MIWGGYPHFRKPTHTYIYIYIYIPNPTLTGLYIYELVLSWFVTWMIWIYFIYIYTVNWVYKPTYNCGASPRTKPVFSNGGCLLEETPINAWKKITVSWKAICYPIFFPGMPPFCRWICYKPQTLPFSKSSSTLNWRYLAPPNRCLMSCSQFATVIWIRAIPSFQLVQCQEWNVTWMAIFFIMMLAPTHHCQCWEYNY